MRILITGAAGFIGSHFVEHLLKETDWELFLLDKLSYASSGLDRLTDIQAVSTVLKNFRQNRVSFYAADLCQPIPSGLAKEIGQVDYVVHMAAETHVDNSIADPEPFIQSNIIGTYHILEFVRKYLPSLQKFIYFSTDEVFGPAADGQAFLEWDRYNSTNPYSATKAAGEELAMAWANTYGLPITATHAMNNFGERQYPEKFIPLVVSKLLRGEVIQVHCDRTKKKSGGRSYIHARNTADAVLFLLREQYTARDKFNIIGEQEVTNVELVEWIGEILNELDMQVHPRIDMVDYHSSRPGHDLMYRLDGSKMKKMGWEPPKTFEESLLKTIKWMVAPKNLKWLLKQKEAVQCV